MTPGELAAEVGAGRRDAEVPGDLPALAEGAGARGRGAGLRLDLDAFLVREPLRPAVLRVLAEGDGHARAELLAELRALLVEALEVAMEGRTRVRVSTGERPLGLLVPGDAGARMALAARVGADPAGLARAVRDLRPPAGPLGARGVRATRGDPELARALLGAAIEARAVTARGGVARLEVVLPRVSFPGELDLPARLAGEEAAATRASRRVAVEVVVGAGVACAGGLAAARGAPFVEVDLEAMTETWFGLAAADAPGCAPAMRAAGAIPGDPFEELDPVLAAWLARELAAGPPATLRWGRRLRRGVSAACGAAVELQSVPAWMIDEGAAGVARRSVPAGRMDEGGGSAPARRAPAPADPVAVPPPARLEDPTPAAVRDYIARVEGAGEDPGVREALLREASPALVDALTRPAFAPHRTDPASRGVGVSGGVGVGEAALGVEAARRAAAAGRPYVLVIRDVFGDEAAAVRDAAGVVAARGGTSSHAAVVAANAGVPCVIDETLRFDPSGEEVRVGSVRVRAGEVLAVDGGSGELFPAALEVVPGPGAGALAILLGWADRVADLRVLANADAPGELARALDAGAAGVGLVRAEHLLLEPARLRHFRVALLAEGARRAAALDALRAFLEEELAAWFELLGDRPARFRVLDAPLHEFLPRRGEELAALASDLGGTVAEMEARVAALRPAVPLMGVRGVRVAYARPELLEAHVAALARAWRGVHGGRADPPPLECILPMLVGGAEARVMVARVRGWVAEVDPEIPVRVHAMVEVPRAAADAADLAREVDGFSWGTNDLTQFLMGLGRDAAPAVLAGLPGAADPGAALDPRVVVPAMEAALRVAGPGVHSCVCGRQAADAASLEALVRLGVDAVSVSPEDVRRTRVLAARASLRVRA